MSSQLHQAFELIRTKCTTDNDRGTAFERLVKVFLENDPVQTQEYATVWHYRDWAKDKPNYTNHDIGIDLVAQIRADGTYCAIQCKFYAPEHQITKSDLDSFISASMSSDFTRLLLIDTSSQVS